MKKIFTKLSLIFKKSKAVGIAFAVCGAVALVFLCFTAYAASYDRVFPNVYVGYVNLGGMSEDAVKATVNEKFAEQIKDGRQVTFKCCGNEKEILLSDLDIAVDSEKTAEKALSNGREGGTIKKAAKLILAVFKKTELLPSVALSTEKLDAVIREMAKGSEVEPENISYALNGNSLSINMGHGGKMVDRKKAEELIVMAVSDPEKTELLFEVEELEAEKLDFEKFYSELTSPEKNAEYSFENGEVVIIPEHIGIVVEKEKVRDALKNQNDTYTLTVETKQPEITAENLKAMLFRDTLGTFSSSFATSSAARAKNVMLTAERINGYILMPGDVFSYDKTIGSRTAANGYKEANVYVGNKVESGIGGGICQTSSTLYSAALYANLEIVSRTSHSLPVSYVPLGQDATIAEGYIDLKLKNNTEYPIKIVATVNGRRLTCSILGVKVPGQTVELAHSTISTSEPKLERTVNDAIPKGYKYVINKGAPGYTVASSRIVKQNGEVVKTEKLTKSVYRAAPIEEEVNSQDENTPSENLKIYTPGMELTKEENVSDAPQTSDAPKTPDEGLEEAEPKQEISEENGKPAVNEKPETDVETVETVVLPDESLN